MTRSGSSCSPHLQHNGHVLMDYYQWQARGKRPQLVYRHQRLKVLNPSRGLLSSIQRLVYRILLKFGIYKNDKHTLDRLKERSVKHLSDLFPVTYPEPNRVQTQEYEALKEEKEELQQKLNAVQSDEKLVLQVESLKEKVEEYCRRNREIVKELFDAQTELARLRQEAERAAEQPGEEPSLISPQKESLPLSNSEPTPTDSSLPEVVPCTLESLEEVSGSVIASGSPPEKILAKEEPAAIDENVLALVEKVTGALSKHMDTEGLFGKSEWTQEIEKIAKNSKEGEDVNYDELDVHDLAGLLIKYLKEWPGGVVPYDQCRHIVIMMEFTEGNKEDLVRKFLKDTLQKKYPLNFALVRHLCFFLREVANHSEQNKMTVRNLANCPGAAILTTDDPEFMVKKSSVAQEIVGIMIEDPDHIFC